MDAHITSLILGIALGWLIAHFRNPLCALEAVRDSVKLGVLVAGHRMVAEQEQVEATVTVLKCERCGQHQIGWERKELRGE